jgi:hypothetical protein
MKMPRSTAEAIGPKPSVNGLNHEACGWIELAGWPLVYTVTIETTANTVRIAISNVSSSCWMRADSSIPR